MSGATTPLLERAVQLSRQLLVAADCGDSGAVAILDLERLQLLKSVRQGATAPNAHERQLLEEIARLNDASIGYLEHHRRIK